RAYLITATATQCLEVAARAAVTLFSFLRLPDVLEHGQSLARRRTDWRNIPVSLKTFPSAANYSAPRSKSRLRNWSGSLELGDACLSVTSPRKQGDRGQKKAAGNQSAALNGCN